LCIGSTLAAVGQLHQQRLVYDCLIDGFTKDVIADLDLARFLAFQIKYF